MAPILLLGYPMINSSVTNGMVMALFGATETMRITCEDTGRTCHTSEGISRCASARTVSAS